MALYVTTLDLNSSLLHKFFQRAFNSWYLRQNHCQMPRNGVCFLLPCLLFDSVHWSFCLVCFLHEQSKTSSTGSQLNQHKSIFLNGKCDHIFVCCICQNLVKSVIVNIVINPKLAQGTNLINQDSDYCDTGLSLSFPAWLLLIS